MDFKIIQTETSPEGEMVFSKNEDIRTSIYNSLSIRKASFFQNPVFGCELYKIKKITQPNILLAKTYVDDCLKWLISTGRATTITSVVEQDRLDYNRLNVKVTATQPNGLIITYSSYQRVGAITEQI